MTAESWEGSFYCVKGKEKWNAGIGKCEAVKKKMVKKAAKPKK